MLGGSSSINGMVYIRGNARDFDRWEEEGARGWAYRDVLPYFRRAEARAEGGDDYRGGDGPLHNRYGTMRNPLYRAFIEAARQAGYPETEDVNGYQQEGFGRIDMTVHHGPALARRQRLSEARRCAGRTCPCAPHALATRILFEGRRAIGVEYRRTAPSASRDGARAR